MMNELCIITAVKENKWTKRSLLTAPNHVNKFNHEREKKNRKVRVTHD